MWNQSLPVGQVKVIMQLQAGFEPDAKLLRFFPGFGDRFADALSALRRSGLGGVNTKRNFSTTPCERLSEALNHAFAEFGVLGAFVAFCCSGHG